jgi:rod shape determining protein RodA
MSRLFTPRAFVDYRQVPRVMLGAALALSAVGVLFIASAHSWDLAARQGVYLGVALVGLAVASRIDLDFLAANAFYLYAAGLVTLLLLPVLGVRVNNAVRWYDLGLVRVQPSEFVKLAMVLLLAEHFRFLREAPGLRALLAPLAFTICPMILIVLQPDLGTALLFLPLFFGMAFLGGARVRHLAVIAGVLAALAVVAWATPGVVKGYQRQRVLAWIYPDRYLRSAAGYNSRQAVLAITAGGLTGQGWGEGVLNQLRRIPERHTDFIFAVVAEEWGFLRTAAVIAGYLILLAGVFVVAWRAREGFGRLVAGGVLCLVGTQALLHIGISLRLAPITGLTLPLMSYGGSSLVMMFVTLGLVVNVAIHKPIVFASEKMRA